MSTTLFSNVDIRKENTALSALRAIVETPFYGNNVQMVHTLQEAYDLAIQSPGTIITDLPIENPDHLGLRSDAKVLLFNDGAVTGRTAAARRIVGENTEGDENLRKKVMDAIYQTRYQKLYHAQVLVGLDERFMIRAHLLIPEGEENILYNWMLNFQPLTTAYEERYAQSKSYEEGDLFLFSSPQWAHPEHPMGLTYFDPEHNCAALLGMRYFGEHKKGTLTLAWSMANRHQFTACHGGAKRLMQEGKEPFVLAVFGLSGSGKSTITHAQHPGYTCEVLHDDAFIVHTTERYSVAMEPTYFDKTADYPCGCPDEKYLLTVQNCGATRNAEGKIVLVSEDVRNGNGRAIKSRLWSKHRTDLFAEPLQAIAWIMKDAVLPPLMRTTTPSLSALFGATLSTKRTNAERLQKGVDPNALVIEPYANPFRTYGLRTDYEKFLGLFENGVRGYILNTGFFLDKKVPKEITLEAVLRIVKGSENWKPFPGMEGLEYLPFPGFEPDWNEEYAALWKQNLQFRLQYLEQLEGVNALPEDALIPLRHAWEQLS